MPEVQLHAPGQVLPRGNAATVADRLRRWCCFLSSGSSEHLGGADLAAAAAGAQLQIHVHVTDALTVNTCIHGMEERGWQERRRNGDQAAKHVARLVNYCLHHQASLAKKPSLLQIPKLCSGLVRMCNLLACWHVSNFNPDLEYDSLTVCVVVPVATFPRRQPAYASESF